MIDETLLMAYADGELDVEASQQIETELQRDPELAEWVAGYQRDAALLKTALQSALNATPGAPPDLEDSTQEQAAPPRSAIGRRPSEHALPWALAAGMAALALGTNLDRLPGLSTTPLVTAKMRSSPSDLRYERETLDASLETSVSGVSLEWRNPDTGSSGEITPVRTFQTADGRYCREYQEIQWLSHGREERGGIACRQSDGMWKVRLRYYPD